MLLKALLLQLPLELRWGNRLWLARMLAIHGAVAKWSHRHEPQQLVLLLLQWLLLGWSGLGRLRVRLSIWSGCIKLMPSEKRREAACWSDLGFSLPSGPATP